ncbi:uncharacterized protein GGS25DRAFT_259128 [Hypoxylon fragiforme]|uniref:uncharacterized protein n=1 Tax=Hypoxylon fragiforme TaxID=63214 RepID=UPI0020C61C19|nr:uncharacterized protein GGS25DRAFT_259128 [Hypoxylon fragiforme]KAI2610396.1 hypothetical protein GGS25DRAFT_259128 [Hypoxylon fragiforme]
MRHAKFSFPLQVGCLLLASASKISLPPAVTQAEYSAFAGIHLLPAVTPKPSASVELLRRQSELSGVISGYNTCGYGALNPAISVTCSSDERCENIGQFRACCNGDPIACSATVQTSCKDYDPTIICATKTRCCKSAEPYCITWLYNVSVDI